MSSRVLTSELRTEGVRQQGDPVQGWRTLAGFGLVIALIGMGQLALYVFPSLGFGSPEWEYGASAQVIGALPLPTMGLGAMFAAGFALNSRGLLITLSALLVLLSLMVLAALLLFWSVVPVALRATPEAVDGPIIQTIARTTLSGLGFGLLYLWTAWRAVRQVRRSPRRTLDA